MNRIEAGGVAWHVEHHGNRNNSDLVFVHGFAGSLRTWDRLVPKLDRFFHLHQIDLPGHGNTPLPDDPRFSMRRLWEAFGKLLPQICDEPPLVCGYSMGGRIALHYAVHEIYTVRGLILIGASPGIADAQERKQRLLDDHRLAENIRTNGIEWFADYWRSRPLFDSQKSLPEEVQAELMRARLACDPRGLAYALERFGTGQQEYLGDQLKKLTCPLLLLAGALDQKFCASNNAMVKIIGSQDVRRVEIAGAGHAAHIERPDLVAHKIIEFHKQCRSPFID